MKAPDKPRSRLRTETLVTVTGMVINITLAVGKVCAGIVGRSNAIIADGLHSFSDLASDIPVLWSITAAKQPPDHDHHYGHTRYESIVALFVGILLVIAALYIAAQAIATLSEHRGGISNWLPFWWAVASIVTKELLYWWTRAVGKRFHNQAIIANAWHHRSDAFSSIAAAIGIAGARIGGERWAFLDHLTAVLLAAFLVFAGIRIIRQALYRLTDRAPDPNSVTQLHAIITNIPGVRSFHAFRARHSGAGNQIEMDVHVQVDPEISVRTGHEIAERIEKELRNANPNLTGIVIHIEPSEPEKTH